MSGMIFFGHDKDTNEDLDSGLNGYYFDAFELLIERALLPANSEIFEIIDGEEAKAFNYLLFCRLDSAQMKTTVNKVRALINSWDELLPWQMRAKEVWDDFFEPWLLRDKRME